MSSQRGSVMVHHAQPVDGEDNWKLGDRRLSFGVGPLPSSRDAGDVDRNERIMLGDAEAIVELLTTTLPGGTLMRVFALLAKREAERCGLLVAFPPARGNR